MLTRWLRPHQREGVQFMFDCVCGLRLQGNQGKGIGCDWPQQQQQQPSAQPHDTCQFWTEFQTVLAQ
jgi:hypothetical protein